MNCTTIDQSKHLLELGLKPETADMYYSYVLPKSDKLMHNPQVGIPTSALYWYNKGYTKSGKEALKLEEFCVPAWSLEALLEVIPHTGTYGIELNNYSDGKSTWTAIFRWKGVNSPIRLANTPTPAVYEIVCWLLGNGYIKED